MIVRFAPSPTGYLHIGGARTAIFNWLTAHSDGGRFLLRIEDTDRLRSSEAMTREILDGLHWLGIDWDEAPLIQSARLNRHAGECHRLLAEGNAYWCYCSSHELEEHRRTAEAAGGAFLYDGTCRRLSAEERAEKDAAGLSRVLRFRVPEGRTVFNDIVHDEISFSNTEIDDFVILRSDGTPTYMMAVVVDDHDMHITHVLRGDDHLSNTPKQIMLYHALGYETPQFGHLPLILGEDKKRLSKRHGATSVGEFQQRGYLPEALFNFLALLGWSPGEDREIMTKEELIHHFDLRRVLNKSAIFDEDKLRWINGQHIRRLTDDDLLHRLLRHRPADLGDLDPDALRPIVPLMKERISLLPEFFSNGRYFWRDPDEFDAEVIAKRWKAGIPEALIALLPLLETTEFAPEALETLIREFAEQQGMGAGRLIHPLRLALTGGGASPSLFDMMHVLGREVCLRRLRHALAILPAS
ncbi:MAG: glutamate--tRNA ligase, partial [Bacteroidetes bacterium]|nr:glutamate--tRNA ligase [Bacteroidota bacterium]